MEVERREEVDQMGNLIKKSRIKNESMRDNDRRHEVIDQAVKIVLRYKEEWNQIGKKCINVWWEK